MMCALLARGVKCTSRQLAMPFKPHRPALAKAPQEASEGLCRGCLSCERCWPSIAAKRDQAHLSAGVLWPGQWP